MPRHQHSQHVRSTGGWRDFSLDHGLKVGDLLVFNYIMGSHFVVQIYGRSGCSELRHIDSYGIMGKKARTEGYFIKTGERYHANNNCLVPPASVECETVNELSRQIPAITEKPLYFDNGSIRQYVLKHIDSYGIKEKGARSEGDFIDNAEGFHLGDNYLVPKVSVGSEPVDKVSKHFPAIADRPVDFENRSVRQSEVIYLEEPFCIIDRDDGHMQEDRLSLFDLSTFEIPKNQSAAIGGTKFPVGRDRPAENGKKNIAVWKEAISKNAVESDTCHTRSDTEGIVQGDHSFAREDNDAIFERVKTEPVEFSETTPPETNDTSMSWLAVVGCREYLELPPSITWNAYRRLDRKVIVLRGPDNRIWPALYQMKHGLKFLSSGWEAFAKANRISLGDECNIELENQSESIYRVRIVHKVR